MSNVLETGRVFSEARLVCEDVAGNLLNAAQFNLGWHESAHGYVSKFVVDGVSHYSLFQSARSQDDVCPDPAQRLSFDTEFLERRCALMLVDAELVTPA